MDNFNFNPTNGLLDQSAFPDNPGSGAEARTQIQTPMNQIRDYINATLVNFFNNGGTVSGTLYVDGLLKTKISSGIEFNNDDKLTYNDTTNTFTFSSDGGKYASYVEAGGFKADGTNVVESGTTATGKWVKFYDGTMICYLYTTQTTVSINTAYGSLFQGSYTWTFPVAFISTPTVTCGAFKHGTGASWGTVADVSTTNSNLRGIDVYSRASGTATLIQAMAIGKWK